ncbi:tRNA pseudouridine(38-40) synthase TruA [Anditalea andensis]|uniref:tRNA pseudouridine synthase A n=1 Tax=Anditalea andensis TaxID=1048983 RepID=A0A074KTP8_9BACT|nr:tRNA pseudouridine(38-40) synthase TruA [Anditalea andensis]KEO73351.1 pseudouridine synthase [Anditalea andensis]
MNEQYRYFVEIAYKGTAYHGWQIQQNAHSIQEEVNLAFSKILRSPVEVMGSGRTDTGVHAIQQFVHFDSILDIDSADFLKRANSILPKDIAVYAIRKVKPDVHARFQAQWRSYEYHITLRKQPFLEEQAWYCFYQVDLDKMNQAALLLLDHTDFECFSRVKTNVNNFNCKIKVAHWEQKDHHLIFHITANRFLRGMVRAIVGTLVKVGMGKMDKEDFMLVLQSQKRSKAGSSAPAHGLFLSSVTYPEDIYI